MARAMRCAACQPLASLNMCWPKDMEEFGGYVGCPSRDGRDVHGERGLLRAYFMPFGQPPPAIRGAAAGPVNFGLQAGVVQWENGSYPSSIRGFDSLHPLH